MKVSASEQVPELAQRRAKQRHHDHQIDLPAPRPDATPGVAVHATRSHALFLFEAVLTIFPSPCDIVLSASHFSILDVSNFMSRNV
ncbi:hypothetical protein [Ralstonia sp.]|uniref:hypothetical protein n=1 Tax=Ralstonia sp. TaxID=54061 RepID=UPI002BB88121|nr:hypothetical protein [Ralstonia sp.]HWV04941.1 hypothetical protein [Ralstonia sp.]